MLTIRQVTKEPWVILETLSLKEKEILFITAEAAGMLVFPPTRVFRNEKVYPNLYFDGQDISGIHSLENVGSLRVNYEEVLAVLREIIKEKSNETWNQYKRGMGDN